MKLSISDTTLILLALLLLLLWLLCQDEESEPPAREAHTMPTRAPYLTQDEIAANQWREGKIS